MKVSTKNNKKIKIFTLLVIETNLNHFDEKKIGTKNKLEELQRTVNGNSYQYPLYRRK